MQDEHQLTVTLQFSKVYDYKPSDFCTDKSNDQSLNTFGTVEFVLVVHFRTHISDEVVELLHTVA
jgi:hypothetical protein